MRSYVYDEGDYIEICETKNRQVKSGETIFDFYSYYFLYFMMDCCTKKEYGKSFCGEDERLCAVP